jgi:hypothetical protein
MALRTLAGAVVIGVQFVEAIPQPAGCLAAFDETVTIAIVLLQERIYVEMQRSALGDLIGWLLVACLVLWIFACHSDGCEKASQHSSRREP